MDSGVALFQTVHVFHLLHVRFELRQLFLWYTYKHVLNWNNSFVETIGKNWSWVTFAAIAQDVCHVYVTNKVIAPRRTPFIRYVQNARRFTSLFSNTLTFQYIVVSSSPAYLFPPYLTRAEYHNNSYNHEKRRMCQARWTAVQYSCKYSSSLLYQNDLVAIVNEE